MGRWCGSHWSILDCMKIFLSFVWGFFGFIYLFLERREGREKERERSISVWLLLMWPPLGTWPTTQACALTGNWTGNPLVCSLHSIHWATPARSFEIFLIILGDWVLHASLNTIFFPCPSYVAHVWPEGGSCSYNSRKRRDYAVFLCGLLLLQNFTCYDSKSCT